jgi:thiol:disulfide interchange protein DsbD
MPHRACRAFLAATALGLAWGAASSSQQEFLPPEKAFTYLIEWKGDALQVQWNVAPGYYLYKSRMGMESATPGVKIDTPIFPRGEIHHDDYFGDQEIFRDDFVVTAPTERKTRSIREITVKLKWQGCAEAGLCYPITTWEARVPLPTSP